MTMPEEPTDESVVQPRRVVAVGGGKGGVGKTIMSVNLAIAMAEEGLDVVLVDCDLGMANTHTMLGIEDPGPGLAGFLTRTVGTLDNVRQPTGVNGLSLIPGGAGTYGAANINHGQKQRLLRHLGKLEADVVVLDIGAGLAFNTLDLYNAADQRVVVMTPQVTSIHNAYRFIKGTLERALRDAAPDKESRRLVEDVFRQSSELERTVHALSRIASDRPDLAPILQRQQLSFGARIIGNMVFDGKEEHVFDSIAKMVRDFLGVDVQVLGSLSSNRALRVSVNRRKPLLCAAPQDFASAQVRKIAHRLLQETVSTLRAARSWQTSGLALADDEDEEAAA